MRAPSLLRNVYESYAPNYVSMVMSLAFYYGRVGDFLGRHASGSQTVLDLGCGPGHLTAELPSTVQVIGLDFAERMVEVARAARPAGQYHVHDLHDPLPLDTASIDVVLCVGVLDFCFALEPVVAELARVMRPGARALLSFVDRRPHERARRVLFPRRGDGLEMVLYARRELRRVFGQHRLRRHASARAPGYFHRGYQQDIVYSFWDLERT